MRSCSSRMLLLCLIAVLTVVPTSIFAQSTGTFTVYKDFADNNPGDVSFTLACFNASVTNNPQTASEGSPAQFNITDAKTGAYCNATENDLPDGYTSNEGSSCFQVQLVPDDSPPLPDIGTTSGSCTVTNTPSCGDGFVTYAEQCDVGPNVPGDCCYYNCQFSPQGNACGDPTSTACDAPNTCDSAGVCVDRVDPAGFTCQGALGVCDRAEVCDGSSKTCPVDGPNLTSVCRPADGACDQAESCSNASNNCPADGFLAADTVCNESLGECDAEEVCDGTSADCPLDVQADYGTLCGDVPDFECVAQDICDGSTGTCIPNPDPIAACGVIGKGDGCELNICDYHGPSDFKLLFTPDLPNWVAYKLNASNPGQLFYTLLSEPDVPDDATLLLQVPFPFVTQGNMTLHVFDADAVEVDDVNSCLIIDQGAGSTPYPVEITMDTYWDAENCIDPTVTFPTEPGAYCIHEGTTVCPSDYDPDNGAGLDLPPPLALQECWAYVPVELENEGRFAARLHLDYGLKGKWLDTYCPSDDNVDRYAPGAKGKWGDFEARGIDVTVSSTSNYWLNTCNIPTCQPYTFGQGVETEEPSDCYSAHGGPAGCDNEACEEAVCNEDGYCCAEEWDSKCADEAAEFCESDLVAPVDLAESVVQSVNYWKKPLGIFGRAFCSNDYVNDDLDGAGFGLLQARLFKYYAAGPNSGQPLAKSPTDEDGYYFLNYKHKGKAVYYHVELWYVGPSLYDTSDDLLLAETPNGTNNPGGVPLQANGFAEQDFHDHGTCSTANATGWVVDPYEITKGKFKTIQ